MKNLLVITLLFTGFGFGSVFDQTLDITSLECTFNNPLEIRNKPKVVIRINHSTNEVRYQMLEKVKFETKTYLGKKSIYADYGSFEFLISIEAFNMRVWDKRKDKEGEPKSFDNYQCKAIL